MTTTPLVSVVLATHDRLPYLREAVGSVLAQSFSTWELIVADDGSGPATRDYLGALEDPRIRTIWLSRTGNPSQVRNAAIAEARGVYVAFLDSDDVWAPTKLETQIAALLSRPGHRWSYTGAQRIDEQGRLVADTNAWVPYEGSIVEPLLTVEAYVALPTVMAERALIVEVGGFDEELRFGEDYDLWLRLAARSDVAVVQERLTRVRLHADNYSHDRIGFYGGWLCLYAKASAASADLRVRSICRARRATLSLSLSQMYAERRDPAAVCRTLAGCWSDAGADPRWWFGASKAMAKALLPSQIVQHYRRWRG